MQRLVLYFDGTWNRPAAKTNVHRLYRITAERDGDVVQQAEYVEGVGRTFEWLRGGILGFGTARNIRHGYAWLHERYEEGDEIYVFGFSRGAYAARSLAGMISRFGVLPRGSGTTVEQVYRRYAAKRTDRFPDSRDTSVHFVGVWDTVGALGVPWGHLPWLSRSTLFHDTSPSPRYRNMFHALAIDEHRAAFAPTLWTEDGVRLQPGQTIEQRWFVGSHSDVGGNRQDRGLAHVPLWWMYDRARACGLAFTETVTPERGLVHQPIGDSYDSFLHGWYRRIHRDRAYRPIGEATKRMPDGQVVRPLSETIDESVFDRWRANDDEYQVEARNLDDWRERAGVDPSTVKATIPAR
jgi:uncharacterized protein (DUF2235 family)